MIGIFDSGVGGLSVLKELKKKAPHIDVIYFGDIKNAPYGSKSQEELKKLTFLGVKKLLENGATNIISACNSISTFMILEDIKILSENPFGIVEMINPTVEEFSKTDDKILLFATPATIESNTYQDNFLKNGIKIKTQSIPELAGAIEFGSDDIEIEKIVNEAVLKSFENENGTVLLCCTHYPFVADKFEKSFRDKNKKIKIFNPAEAVIDSALQKFDTEKGTGVLRFLISQDSPTFRKITAEHFREYEYTIEII